MRIKVLCVIVAIAWVFMVNMLLITKVHYMVDVVGGIIFAVFAYRTFIRLAVYVDKIFSLPFVGGKKLY